MAEMRWWITTFAAKLFEVSSISILSSQPILGFEGVRDGVNLGKGCLEATAVGSQQQRRSREGGRSAAAYARSWFRLHLNAARINLPFMRRRAAGRELP
jgi:hypothetical protein